MLKVNLSEATFDEILKLEEDIKVRKFKLKEEKVFQMRVQCFDSYKDGYLSLFQIQGTVKEVTYTGYKRIPIRYKLNGNKICDAYEMNKINKLHNIDFPLNNDEDGYKVTIRLLGNDGVKVLDIGDQPYCRDTVLSLMLNWDLF